MKNKTRLWLLAAAAAAIAGLAYYFLYFIHTPAYALTQARLALQQHDAEKFSQYVDTKSVMNNAFEDIIKAESKINNDNLFANPFALSILHMLKPSVVELMEQEALVRIAARPAQEKQPADPVPDAMMRNMERRIPLDSLSVKDLQLSGHSDGSASAALMLHCSELEKDFIAELAMELNEQKVWQIKRVSNLEALIVQLAAAKKARQAAADRAVLERLSKAVQASEAHLSMTVDRTGTEPQTLLSASITVKNLTEVPINRMYYDVLVLDEQGSQLYSYPEHFRGLIAPGQAAELSTSKKLNKMLPDDKRLMGLDIAKEKCRIRITYIAFDDGNVISPSTFIE